MKKRIFLFIFIGLFTFLISSNVYADSNIFFIDAMIKDNVDLTPYNTTTSIVEYDLSGSSSYELALRGYNISDEEDYNVMINGVVYQEKTAADLNTNGITIANDYTKQVIRLEVVGKTTNNYISIDCYDTLVLHFDYPTASDAFKEVISELNSIPNTSYENGEYNIQLPTRSIEEMYNNTKLTENNLEEYCASAYCDPNGGIDLINDTNKYFRDTMYNGIITNYFKSLGLENFIINTYDYINQISYIDSNKFEITVNYQDGSNLTSYNRFYNFTTLDNLDNSLISEVDEIISNTKISYVLKGTEYLNALYHYGGWIDILYQNDLALYMYQDLKELIVRNKDYDFDIYSSAGGDTINGGGADGLIIIKKNGIIYGVRPTSFSASYILLVDQNKPGTTEEKIRQVLNKYFKNESYQLNGKTAYMGDYDGLLLSGEYYFIQLRDSGLYDYVLTVLEAPASYIKEHYTQAVDIDTDVNIVTNGLEVPLDVELEVKSKKNDKNIISLLSKYDYEMIDAYNINLYGHKNHNSITTIRDGVEVYIPIKGYNEGDVITIRHIKDDGTLGEELQGTVVKKDNKLYAKFTTTHFSTYALVESTIDNPPTGDNIINYVTILLVSLSMISGTTIIYKKTIINKN